MRTIAFHYVIIWHHRHRSSVTLNKNIETSLRLNTQGYKPLSIFHISFCFFSKGKSVVTAWQCRPYSLNIQCSITYIVVYILRILNYKFSLGSNLSSWTIIVKTCGRPLLPFFDINEISSTFLFQSRQHKHVGTSFSTCLVTGWYKPALKGRHWQYCRRDSFLTAGWSVK